MDGGAARHEAGEVPVTDICKRFGLTRYQLRRAREAGGWRAWDPVVARPADGAEAPALLVPIGMQLSRIFRTQLARLDQRVLTAGGEIDDREAQTLFELYRVWSLMKTMRTARGAKAARDGSPIKKNNDAGSDYTQDPVWLRARLEARIRAIREADGPGNGGGNRERDG